MRGGGELERNMGIEQGKTFGKLVNSGDFGVIGRGNVHFQAGTRLKIAVEWDVNDSDVWPTDEPSQTPCQP